MQCQKQEEGLVSLEKPMYKANGRMKIIGFNYVDKVDIDGYLRYTQLHRCWEQQIILRFVSLKKT